MLVRLILLLFFSNFSKESLKQSGFVTLVLVQQFPACFSSSSAVGRDENKFLRGRLLRDLTDSIPVYGYSQEQRNGGFRIRKYNSYNQLKH